MNRVILFMYRKPASAKYLFCFFLKYFYYPLINIFTDRLFFSENLPQNIQNPKHCTETRTAYLQSVLNKSCDAANIGSSRKAWFILKRHVYLSYDRGKYYWKASYDKMIDTYHDSYKNQYSMYHDIAANNLLNWYLCKIFCCLFI